MRPHLVRWHESYAAKGLTILDVHNGRIDANREALWKSLRKEKVPFAVAHDAEEKSVKRYGIGAYPTAYLIGKDGHVLWEGFPLPEVGAIERRIRDALGLDATEPERPAKAPLR